MPQVVVVVRLSNRSAIELCIHYNRHGMDSRPCHEHETFATKQQYGLSDIDSDKTSESTVPHVFATLSIVTSRSTPLSSNFLRLAPAVQQATYSTG